MNSAVENNNDDLHPEEFITSDADDNNDEAEVGTVATRTCGWWFGWSSSNKYTVVLVTTISCALAAGGSSIKAAYDKKTSNAADVQTSYGGYSAAASKPTAVADGDGCSDGEEKISGIVASLQRLQQRRAASQVNVEVGNRFFCHSLSIVGDQSIFTF